MLIKAAINGGRSKAEHPAIPVTPSEIASDVLDCLNAGASAVHFHVRSENGYESLASEDLERSLAVLRVVASTAKVGVSTGAWIVPDPDIRFQTISRWTTLPDFASVNFDEEGAFEVARALLAKSVDVEAGICDASAAEKFAGSGLATRCLRVLLEPLEQDIEKARATVREINAVLDQAGSNLPRLLHGIDETTWSIMEDAIELGYGIRMGFEDTLKLANGTVARTNADLIKEAIAYVGLRPR